MPSKDAPDRLIDIIKTLREQEDQAEIPIEGLLNIFSSRVYGPMLLIPALLAILPTGAIPGVPTITGIIITLVSVQMILSVDYPWLPNKLTDFKISRKKLHKSLDFLEGPIKKIEKYIKPRFSILTKEPWLNAVGIFCMTLGLSMAPLEIIPFAVMLPALSLLLIAVGLTMRDGIWVILGLLASLVTYWLVYRAMLEIIS